LSITWPAAIGSPEAAMDASANHVTCRPQWPSTARAASAMRIISNAINIRPACCVIIVSTPPIFMPIPLPFCSRYLKSFRIRVK
jgi:hypothetical protein